MSKVNDLIKELCPNGVPYKEIKELCKITRGRVISKNELRENEGEYPVYSSQTLNDGVFGKINTYDFDGEYVQWTTDGANAGSIFYRNGKFSVTNVCGLLKVKDEYKDILNTNFLNYILGTVSKNYVNYATSNPKLMSNVVEKIKVAVPPLEVQKEIVRILDKYGKLEAELEEELEARKSQYEFWCEKIFNTVPGKIFNFMDICNDIFLGLTSKVDYVDTDGIPLVRAGNMTSGRLVFDDVKYISIQQYEKLTKYHKPKKGDILISKSGTLGAVCIVDTDIDFGIYESLICLQLKEEINNRFMYHLLQTKKIQNELIGKKTGSAIVHINLQSFKNLNVSIPEMNEQIRIAKLLDKFDTLVNDISEGLPAEIELRRKQYEYYRNKLLSFEEV